MKTQTQTVSFKQIVEFAQRKQANNPNPVISVDKYLSTSGYDQRVVLNFTLYGDYCGSTVGKSNYYVLQNMLEEIDPTRNFYEDSSYMTYMGGFSTYAIAIIDDLRAEDWQIITEAIEQVERYPLLDDTHWSDLQLEDCWESWTSWQYFDICRDLGKRDIDLDSDKFQAIYDKDNSDAQEWLWNVILSLPGADNLEITEINACAYYNVDDELIEELADFIVNR